MKKIIVLILSFICLFLLSSCNKQTGSSSISDESSNQETSINESIVSLIKNYNIESCNGFDYSLEQKLNTTVVNSHTIALRINYKGTTTTASRYETSKRLNDEISSEQYIEQVATSYYKNKKVATYEEDKWVWKNCSFKEFANVSISSFKFEDIQLKDAELLTSGQYSILIIRIDDSKSSTFLGVKGEIKNLIIEIKTDANYTQLVSFDMNYNQNLTSTEFRFEPYYEDVTIDIP